MLSALLVGLISYLIASLLGYVIHWAIHKPWAGKAWRAHMAHHLELYPPGDLVSDSYRSAGHRSTVYTFLIAFSPLLLVPAVLCATGVWTLATALACVLATGFVGLLNDIVHDSFHVRRHWLRVLFPGWYEKLQRRHFVHHRNMRRNFGIYSYVWDHVFGTLKE